MSSERGLTPSQSAALLELRSGPKRSTQVAAAMGSPTDNIGTLLGSLYARNLVERRYVQRVGREGTGTIARRGVNGTRWWVWRLTADGRRELKNEDAPAVAR